MHELKKRALKLLRHKILLVFLLGTSMSFCGWDYFCPIKLTRLEHCSMVLLDENSQLISTRLTEDGYWRFPLKLEAVDPRFIRMLIAFEDKRFFYHPGVDPLALARSAWQWFQAQKIVSGGSTLTLQVIRLLEPRPRTLLNKWVECIRALQLEVHFSKKEILEMYLRLAPYGGNIEGLRAASLAYFGKEPTQLTIAEAALLIAIPQKPTQCRPDTQPVYAKLNRNKVISRMILVNVLNEKEAREALEDAVPAIRCLFPRHALHLIYKSTKFYLEGQEYQTTLNYTLQKQLETYLHRQVKFLEPTQTIAVMIVENKTSHIKAYVGSADFFDDKRYGQIDMNLAIRSPGSTLKPFIYALAFDEGIIHPETLIHDIPTSFGHYAPNNLRDVYHGTVTIRDALQQSLNVPAVAILNRLGPGRFSAHLKNFGAILKFDNASVNPSLPLALGGVGMRLYDLVGLYTALANQGQFRSLVLNKPDQVAEVTESKKLMTKNSSSHITQILATAPAPEGFVDGRAIARTTIAFKTGTSYGYRDAWAIGYTGDYTIGVWVGKPDGTPSLNQLGRTHALPILFRTFSLLPESNKDEIELYTLKPIPLSKALSEFKIGNKMIKNDPALFKMHFPKEGTIIHIEQDKKDWRPIPISLINGSPPFYIFENGYLDENSYPTQEILWRPKNIGFVELTILDSAGQSVSANIELK